jgi:hypothetical protein
MERALLPYRPAFPPTIHSKDIIMTIDTPRLMAGSECRPVGVAAREVGILREFIDRAIQRGQIPFDRINGVRVVRLSHARAVKAWRAKEFATWDDYQTAVKAA